jgi:molybdopterin-guanine dinucleotide biosynthesis protein A/alkylated DNA repair dioxygenase AlkB
MLQLGLFAVGDVAVDGQARLERTELGRRAWLEVRRGWLQGADRLCQELIEGVPWAAHRRWMYERWVDEPRLSRWYARGGDVHPSLALAGDRLQSLYSVPLVGPGLNYYRDGRDSVAFHADRELRYLEETIVAIITLGAARPFLVKPRGGGASVDLRPASGDLLVMGGACQAYFEHAVPKVAASGPRVSASWRWASRSGGARRPGKVATSPEGAGPRRCPSPTGPPRPSAVAGVLLTGGGSRRMGFDKALLEVDGRRNAARVGAALSEVAAPVVEIGPGVSGLSALADERPGEGPLVATAAAGQALRARGHRGPVVVVACDLPFISAADLALLVGWPGSASVVPVVDGHPQPLCARWAEADVAAAADLVAAGEKSMMALVRRPGVLLVGPEHWSPGEARRIFADVDTPDDLRRWGLRA